MAVTENEETSWRHISFAMTATLPTGETVDMPYVALDYADGAKYWYLEAMVQSFKHNSASVVLKKACKKERIVLKEFGTLLDLHTDLQIQASVKMCQGDEAYAPNKYTR